MSEAKRLIDEYINLVEKILVEFSKDEDSAIKLLGELKDSMEKKNIVEKDYKELFDACMYNALATINTAPNQNKKNTQLLEALTDAKEEMKTIGELL